MILNGTYVKDELIITAEYIKASYNQHARIKRYSDNRSITIDDIDCSIDQYEIAIAWLERNMSK